MVLDYDGFDVHAVRTGAEGLAFLHEGVRCCFVLLDWWLPDMGGKDFLRAQQDDPELAHIPVTVLSADHQEAMSAGARSFLLKPCDLSVLLDLLADHCAKRTPSDKLAG
jgi:two-component system chemotaxis response regulator CheY